MAVSVMETAPIMSMALSPDNAYILVNLASHTIHLWPLEPMLRQLDALHSGQISPGAHLRPHCMHILLPATQPGTHVSDDSVCVILGGSFESCTPQHGGQLQTRQVGG